MTEELGLENNGRLPEIQLHKQAGERSALRISRVVSEMLRFGLEDVRWFLADDDTIFIVENLVRVLAKYGYAQFYYIALGVHLSAIPKNQNIYIFLMQWHMAGWICCYLSVDYGIGEDVIQMHPAVSGFARQ